MLKKYVDISNFQLITRKYETAVMMNEYYQYLDTWRNTMRVFFLFRNRNSTGESKLLNYYYGDDEYTNRRLVSEAPIRVNKL